MMPIANQPKLRLSVFYTEETQRHHLLLGLLQSRNLSEGSLSLSEAAGHSDPDYPQLVAKRAAQIDKVWEFVRKHQTEVADRMESSLRSQPSSSSSRT